MAGLVRGAAAWSRVPWRGAAAWSRVPRRGAATTTAETTAEATAATAPLHDSFGRRHSYLRVSLTDRCNLRCAYCMPLHPQFSPKPHLLSTPEVLRLIQLFRAAGVNKLRLTGGEPLMRTDLPQIVAAASPHLPVSITTNGVLLSRRLPDLMAAGLSAVNLSLDSLCPHTFALLTRRPAATHARVLSALNDALQQPGLAVKLNVVVMSPINDASLPQFAALTEHQSLDVRFIEYMPFDGNQWRHASFVPYSHMLQTLARHYGRLQHEPTHATDTSKYYRIPGFAGRVGFISSMSDHFCAGCNRLRITADGALKTCLFGEQELSLRDLMRDGATDDQLLEAVRHALQLKNFALGGKRDMHALAVADNRSMVRIGG